MTKKEYILKLLTALENSWEVAPGLKFLIEKNGLDDDVINMLVEMFDKVIKTVVDQGVKEKLEKGKTFLQKLQEVELKDEEKNTEDLAKLDELLKTI